MANYYEQCRSNYFKVKYLEAFKAFLKSFEPTLTLIEDGDRVGFLAEEGLPSYRVAEEDDDEDGDRGDDEDGVDFFPELAQHLQDGEVAIITGCGYEKMRCMTGFATAVNSKGEIQYVSIEEIYDRAKTLTDRPGDITRAEY